MADTCVLFSGVVGILVQFALLLLSLIVLVVRELLERTQRSWSVFCLDSSKQVFGVVFLHVLNLLTSVVLPGQVVGDACNWYWVNIMVDTTLGVFLEYLLLTGFTSLLARLIGDDVALRCGDYYGEDGYSLRGDIYAKQLAIWCICILGMKLIVAVILLCIGNQLSSIASLILVLVSWQPYVKLFTVMLVTPCIMTAVQFLLTDTFIQKDGLTLYEFAEACRNTCSRCAQTCVGRVSKTTEREKRERFLPRREAVPEDFSAHHYAQLHALEEDKQALEKRCEKLEKAETKNRRDKENAERQMRKFQDDKHAAEEALHKAQQEVRLVEQEREYFRKMLAIADDREKQLNTRIEQLEFSYSAAGNAANAVFAAEVSAAAVAAASCRSNGRSIKEAPERPPPDVDAADVITQFLTPTPGSSPPFSPVGLTFQQTPPSSVCAQGFNTAAMQSQFSWDSEFMMANAPTPLLHPQAAMSSSASQTPPIQTTYFSNGPSVMR